MMVEWVSGRLLLPALIPPPPHTHTQKAHQAEASALIIPHHAALAVLQRIRIQLHRGTQGVGYFILCDIHRAWCVLAYAGPPCSVLINCTAHCPCNPPRLRQSLRLPAWLPARGLLQHTLHSPVELIYLLLALVQHLWVVLAAVTSVHPESGGARRSKSASGAGSPGGGSV